MAKPNYRFGREWAEERLHLFRSIVQMAEVYKVVGGVVKDELLLEILKNQQAMLQHMFNSTLLVESCWNGASEELRHRLQQTKKQLGNK